LVRSERVGGNVVPDVTFGAPLDFPHPRPLPNRPSQKPRQTSSKRVVLPLRDPPACDNSPGPTERPLHFLVASACAFFLQFCFAHVRGKKKVFFCFFDVTRMRTTRFGASRWREHPITSIFFGPRMEGRGFMQIVASPTSRSDHTGPRKMREEGGGEKGRRWKHERPRKKKQRYAPKKEIGGETQRFRDFIPRSSVDLSGRASKTTESVARTVQEKKFRGTHTK
jgi:hypothetical protein